MYDDEYDGFGGKFENSDEKISIKESLELSRKYLKYPKFIS